MRWVRDAYTLQWWRRGQGPNVRADSSPTATMHLIQRHLIAACAFAAPTLAAPTPAAAQGGPVTADTTLRQTSLRAATITATRTETDVLRVAVPVSVIDSTRITRSLINGAADILREEAGVDVIGTGVNQGRPAIRGQRGQRILLLEDGMRLNNSRRQQDFGELPGLVAPEQLARIEVVRGPASVLYGTDAIGGVVNLITAGPQANGVDFTAGSVGYQFGSQGTMSKTLAAFSGSRGNVAFSLDGSARVAGDYEAPAGTYGKVTLADKTPLQLSGVRDRNIAGALAWKVAGSHTLTARLEQYVADDAGFGYIPPARLGGDQTEIQIGYPHQQFDKLTLGFRSGSVGWGAADRFDVTAFVQRNRRDLSQHIFVPFGGKSPPGAGVDIQAVNFTDVGSVGLRAELTKVTGTVTFTYGADLYRDDAKGNDSSATSVLGFGPMPPDVNTRPQIPNATLTNMGVFAQGDVRLTDRISVILGTRAQFAESAPRATPGRTDAIADHSNATGVYAANAVWRATDNLSVVATVGSGFRSPNLVERYFDGPTPEGSAYQKATPDLRPEQSVNVDGGLKYRTGRVSAEISAFRNNIRDAIITTATGDTLNKLPLYQNVNLGKLRSEGVEGGAEVELEAGFVVSANYSTLKSTNISNPALPIGDSYASKLNATLAWRSTTGRYWGEYVVRRNGKQKDISIGSTPVGDVLPAFTVQSVRVGVRGWRIGRVRQDITVGVTNLANTLYAEAANATFFRPEAGRSFVLGLSTNF